MNPRIHQESQILEDSGRYTLPLHEFLRAVAMGDGEYYDPRTSPLANVFDISSNDGAEHFLVPDLLATLLAAGGAEEGYVSTSSLYGSLQALGFLPGQIDSGISRALRFRLVETYPRVLETDEVREAIRIRIRSAGAYIVKRLVSLFSYIDAVIVDTPIVDPSYREKIADERNIEKRLTRAQMFAEYLDEQFRGRGSLEKERPFDWPTAQRQLLERIRQIERRIGAEPLPLDPSA